MDSFGSQLEEAVLQTILPQLEAEGFKVFVHPSPTMLPAFLRTYRPDAIALKGDRKIAIEVKSATADPEAKAARLGNLFQGHPDWELRIVYAPPRTLEEIIPIAPRRVIEERLERIESAANAMDPAAGLLIAWAAFEAAARSLIPEDFGKPQTPARLLETLASNGYITPDEADMLRQLGRVRNQLAHGRLDLAPTRQELENLIRVTRAILSLHDSEAAEAPT